MNHVLTSIHDLINSSSALNLYTVKLHYSLEIILFDCGFFFLLFFTALTSSEPSRQLSCPSHRRLADTQPPLAHTYSLTEHVGTTGEGQSVLVNSPLFSPQSHSDETFLNSYVEEVGNSSCRSMKMQPWEKLSEAVTPAYRGSEKFSHPWQMTGFCDVEKWNQDKSHLNIF